MGKQANDHTIRSVVVVRLLAILLSTILVACSQGSTDESSEATWTNDVKPLWASSATRHFSDENQKDTFNVAVNGESIITGEVDLQITNYEGKRIFSTTFPANALLNHDGLISPKQDEKTIKNRIDVFFKAMHFVSPVAAKADLSTMPDSTKATWRTIEADSTAIYFSYPDGKGSVSQIAYSKKLQKVIQL